MAVSLPSLYQFLQNQEMASGTPVPSPDGRAVGQKKEYFNQLLQWLYSQQGGTDGTSTQRY